MLSFVIALAVLCAVLVVLFVGLPGSRTSLLRGLCVWLAVIAAIVLLGMSVLMALSIPAAESETATPPPAHTEAQQHPNALPQGFSYVRDLAPGIEVELRYATTNNFTGEIVDGYESTDAAILRTEAAEALGLVQRDLEEAGYGLLIYDAFRPTRAVSFFVDWSNSADESTRDEYYPGLEKPGLFQLGYIAEKSGHSLGGTVDVTVIDQRSGVPLDMGGAFDFFGELSHYEAAGLTSAQIANRAVLHDAMIARGFEQYPLEWWHYSFPMKGNPMPENFIVR